MERNSSLNSPSHVAAKKVDCMQKMRHFLVRGAREIMWKSVLTMTGKQRFRKPIWRLWWFRCLWGLWCPSDELFAFIMGADFGPSFHATNHRGHRLFWPYFTSPPTVSRPLSMPNDNGHTPLVYALGAEIAQRDGVSFITPLVHALAAEITQHDDNCYH